LSIPHLPLSLACPFFIWLCLWLNGQARDKGKWRMDKPETKANEEWTRQRQRQM
jgi:hypothetical protein